MSAELTARIVEAVARQTGTDPLELPPLFEAVDPDAIETLCGPHENGRCECTVSFEYADHTVKIAGTDVAVSAISDG